MAGKARKRASGIKRPRVLRAKTATAMYEVRFYTGDYAARQRQANADGCAAYVERHFNSSPSPAAAYTVVITGANASQTRRNWGRWYAQTVAREFDVPVGGDQGIMVGGYNGRGDFSLRFTEMPAILLEPLFGSNPQHAEWIRTDASQARLARILCDSIQRFFQKGGLIGLSVGHKYKVSQPNDRGAKILWGRLGGRLCGIGSVEGEGPAGIGQASAGAVRNSSVVWRAGGVETGRRRRRECRVGPGPRRAPH